jgi:hypothetical protein
MSELGKKIFLALVFVEAGTLHSLCVADAQLCVLFRISLAPIESIFPFMCLGCRSSKISAPSLASPPLFAAPAASLSPI